MQFRVIIVLVMVVAVPFLLLNCGHDEDTGTSGRQVGLSLGNMHYYTANVYIDGNSRGSLAPYDTNFYSLSAGSHEVCTSGQGWLMACVGFSTNTVIELIFNGPTSGYTCLNCN